MDWARYAGSFNATLASANTDRTFGRPLPNFQFHHQPSNYHAKFDPTQASAAAYRAKHLKDFDAQLLQDATARTLPAVSFSKPQGHLNRRPGYANAAEGDAYIANVIAQLPASPQWKNMLIVVT